MAEILEAKDRPLLEFLGSIEWTCEDVNDARGASFCPSCGAHHPECPCDGCDYEDNDEDDESDVESVEGTADEDAHAADCELMAWTLKLRTLEGSNG